MLARRVLSRVSLGATMEPTHLAAESKLSERMNTIVASTDHRTIATPATGDAEPVAPVPL